MRTIDTIRKNALALPVNERAMLAQDLIVSLDDPAAYKLSARQEAEIRRRVELVKEGKAKGRPADRVFAEIAFR